MGKDIKVAVDLMFIENPEHVTGVQSHAEDILAGLREIDRLKYCRLYTASTCRDYFSIKYPEAETPSIDCYSNMFIRYLMKPYSKITGRSGSSTVQKLERCMYSKKARNCDVVLHTFHDDLKSSIVKKVKNIWVFHDFFEQKIGRYGVKRQSAANKKYSEYLQKSDAIVLISHFVENDMHKFFPDIAVSNLHVIPNAVAIDGFVRENADSLVPVPYILNINAITEYKNHITLIKAFQKIMDDIPHALVIVGPPGDIYKELERYVSDNKMSGRVRFLSFISDEEKKSLYLNASLFVTTSLHEGFGRTPIEAAMYGVPVISTRCDSLPEITMEMLDYYDPPCDAHILADKIFEVLSRKTDIEMLSMIAETYRKKYSCRAVAEQYWELIEEVCAS